MKKKIILLQPPVGMFDTITFNIPLGLLAISRHLYNDFDIKIIDLRFKNYEIELNNLLKNDDIVCAGITTLTGYQIFFALQIARYVKILRPDIPIVFGGIHPSLKPAETLASELIDFVVIGEGELTFDKLVRTLITQSDYKKIDFSQISALGYKKNGNIIINPKTTDFYDLSKAPALPYHLIDIKKYVGKSAQNTGNSFLVEAGRGCAHNCIFCFNASFNKRRWRAMTVDKIIEQIQTLYLNYKITGFFIVDDSFFTNINRVFEFCNELKKIDANIQWCAEANLSDLLRLNDLQIKDLENSGLNWLSVGVESGSQKIIDKLNKKITITQLFEFNERIKNYKINIRYNFMCGYIWEDEEDIDDTINVCLKLTKNSKKIMTQPLYVATPLPGTEYLELAKKSGFIEPKNLEQWSQFDPFEIIDKLPWLMDKRKKKIIELLMYSSFFIDAKPQYHSNTTLYGRIISALGRIYRPFARFRFKYKFYWFFIEKYYFKINEFILKKIFVSKI